MNQKINIENTPVASKTVTSKNKNIFEKNSTYFTVCVYTLVTACIIAFLVKWIWFWSDTVKTVSIIIDMLSPFLIGIFIAYLMNPLVKLLDKYLFKKLLHIRKKPNLTRSLSILISYIIVFGILAFCISVIIPEVYLSLKNIYEGVQGNYEKLLLQIDKFAAKHPDIDISYFSSLAQDNSSNIIGFIQNSLNTVIPFLYSTSVLVIRVIINLLIAIMVSCYLLIDKDRLLRNFKRLIYAFMKTEKANSFTTTLKECNKIFSSFIVGKTIDSIIIGFICYIFMRAVNFEYSMLISFIVGLTNMIPYFGPFIGAIPSILILLTVDWRHAIIFAGWILVLQQFDGLYLGPRILGQSTGLRPVWIIFGITIGGWVCGPIGMFLGVPFVGVLAYLIEKSIDKKLKKKNLDI